MRELHLRFAKLIGITDENHWCQAHVFTPSEDKQQKRGQLLVAISLVCPPQNKSLLEIGREILIRLNEEYYGDLTLPPQKQLQATLTKVGQEFTEDQQTLTIATAVFWQPPSSSPAISSRQEEVPQPEIKPEILSSDQNPPSQGKPVVYLATWGRGEIWLNRGSQFGRLLLGQPQQVVTLSGWLHDSDWYILGTPGLFSSIPLGVWRAAINTGITEEAANLLAPLIHGKDDNNSAAGLIAESLLLPSLSQKPQTLTHPQPQIPVSPDFISPSSTPALSGRLGGFKNELFSFLPRFSFPSQIYVHTQSALKSKKTALTVAILLLILLALSVYFGNKKRQQEAFQSSYLPQLEQAETNLSQGQALAASSPDQSRELIWQAQQTVNELSARGIKDVRLDTLQAKLGQVLGAVLGEYPVTGELWQDLSLTRDDFQVNAVSQSESTVWLLQSQPIRLAKLDLDKKEITILAGEKQFSQVFAVAGTPQTAFILSDKGLISFDSQPNLLIKSDDIGSPDNLLLANYGGNLYLLDKTAGEIWRYPATGVGKLGDKQRWLAPGIQPRLSDAKKFAIDGSVWVLYNSGRLEKYLHGAPQLDSITGLDKPLKSPQDIYTDADSKFIYLLDPGNSRIVVLDKDAHYQSQYLWDKLSQAQAIFVQETQKTIYCLIGSQIYKISLK